jgi:hypothetical protein
LVDESAHDGDAEPTDRALFYRSIQMGAGMGERIEGRPIVDEMDHEPVTPPTKRDGDTTSRTSDPVAVCNDIGEKLFEDNEKPRPFVVREATIAAERLRKGLEPGELRSLAAYDDRSPHRGLMPCNSRRQ